MSRLSREKKREQQQAADAANRAAVPVDVRVPSDGSDEPGAYVDGVRVIAGPGEEIQQAVLNRLHRIALATGHAVHATVRDERIGYVVPLRVAPDGSSAFAAQPVQLRGARERGGVPSETPSSGIAPASETPRGPAPSPEGAHTAPPSPPFAPRNDRPTHLLRPVPESEAPEDLWPAPASASASDAQHPETPAAPGAVSASGTSGSDTSGSDTPAPGSAAPYDSPPTFRLRRVTPPPGTVAPPTGVFGPPPDMDARPHPAEPEAASAPAPAPDPDLEAALAVDPDPRPTPPRGFDAVAEAVLGDEPAAPAGSPLADPMERINEAVRAGRIDTAARLADETLEHAAQTLGAEHPEVLRLRELTAYIAYLAGEPVRAFRLSLDLAVACRRAGDEEAAYGNVRSAATAWRGVRDPLLGLELGRDLIALWTELASEGGPAADEEEELDSARARMDRLTTRARDLG
ncbi:tetratricopeptide repeat protein [Streptomyces sp. Akac8]|uniref:tetratricopeptide repeat protein n=1 Tax=Streptomyces sp. Akac8 TaxID=2563106 RepID=UPI00109E404E|nr:tetratricopeptide repeat protein [Streptomyces sp. Akac8]